jgi:hypothetical protein
MEPISTEIPLDAQLYLEELYDRDYTRHLENENENKKCCIIL